MFEQHGPPDSATLVVLAPGDAGRLDDPAPTAIARGLAGKGLRVVRFAFPDGDAPDDAVRDTLLAERIRAAAALRATDQTLVLGGMSRGARVSLAWVGPLGALGLLAFAYPFHPRRDPDPGDRVLRLAEAKVPVLICQGTRDSHGNLQQVRGYGLPDHVRLHWLRDANHALHPRARSGQTMDDQLARATSVAAAWVRELGQARSSASS